MHDVLPQIGVHTSAAEFRVFSMKDGKVYLYEERHSSAQVVDKFFVSGGNHSANAIQRMDHVRMIGAESRVVELRRRVNWRVGTANPSGDPDDQAHPVVNGVPNAQIASVERGSEEN